MPKISDTGTDFLPRVYVAGREIAKGVAKRKHGGAASAYARAQEILAELQTRYPRPDSPIPRLPFYRKPQRTSKHGWSGISRATKTGFGGNWKGEFFGVTHTDEFGNRTQTVFYTHHYRTEAEALRAAVVFRIEWELDQLIQYEERLREWFGQVGAEPWAELLTVLTDLRVEREAMLASGDRPTALPSERAARERLSRAPAAGEPAGSGDEAPQPVTTRVNAQPAKDLGWLPDEDFILSL